MSELRSTVSENHMDRVGIGISALCALHCLLLPLLPLLTPSLASMMGHELIHQVILLPVIAIGGWAFVRCFRLHRAKLPGLFGATGIALLIYSVLVESAHAMSASHAHDISIAGSLLLIAGHLLNIRHCRCLKGSGHVCGGI